MNKSEGTNTQIPAPDKVEAAEALLMLSGGFIRQEILKSLTKSQAGSPHIKTNGNKVDTTMTLQEKKKLIWNLWLPDIKGWRKLMKKHVLDERMYNRLQMYFFRARRMLKEELEQVEIQHARGTAE